MAKTKRSADSKRKAAHHTLMMQHAKHSMQKKRMEAFQEMIKNMPRGAAENVSENAEQHVDIDDIDVNSMVDIESVDIDTSKTE